MSAGAGPVVGKLHRFVELVFKGKRELAVFKGYASKRKCLVSLAAGDELAVETSKLTFVVPFIPNTAVLSLQDFKVQTDKLQKQLALKPLDQYDALHRAFGTRAFSASDAASVLFNQGLPADRKDSTPVSGDGAEASGCGGGDGDSTHEIVENAQDSNVPARAFMEAYAVHLMLLDQDVFFRPKRSSDRESLFLCRSSEDVRLAVQRCAVAQDRKVLNLLCCLRICGRLKELVKEGVLPLADTPVPSEDIRRVLLHEIAKNPSKYGPMFKDSAMTSWNPDLDQHFLHTLQMYALFGHLVQPHNLHVALPSTPIRVPSVLMRGKGHMSDSFDYIQLADYLDDMRHIPNEILRPLRRRPGPQDAHRLCVDLGILDEVQNMSLFLTPLQLDFMKHHEDSAGELVAGVPSVGSTQHLDYIMGSPDKPYDWGDLVAYAIDDAKTRDVDDAVSLLEDGSIVVHIADPGRFFSVASESTDKVHSMAFDRITSVYLPEKTIPMLPSSLSEGLFSLAADRPCAVLSFCARLSSDGTILESRIVPAVVRRIVRLTYEGVDGLLAAYQGAADGAAPHSVRVLTALHRFSVARERFRKASGAIAVDLPQCESRVSYVQTSPSRRGDPQVVLDVQRPYLSKSKSLVQEMMVLAGSIAAAFTSQFAVPVPYRVQAQPLLDAGISAELHAASVASFLPDPSKNVLGYSEAELRHIVSGSQMVRNMTAAIVQVEPGPHAGLGLPGYVHVTSPIRRYGDLVVQSQIKSFLRNDTTAGLPFSAESISQIVCPQMDRVSQLATRLQRESERFWLCFYLDQMLQQARQKGEKFVLWGLVTSLDASDQRGIFGADIMLLSLGMRWRLDVQESDAVAPGMVLPVVVNEVFADRSFVQLSLLRTPPSATTPVALSP
eukprot:ANDGO_08348.mRNA.1 putative ribonuclease sll1290